MLLHKGLYQKKTQKINGFYTMPVMPEGFIYKVKSTSMPIT